jgi:hypothetical protein
VSVITVIAKNVTAFDINLEDMGFTLSASGTPASIRVLTDYFELFEIASSDFLTQHVSAGNIVINDGTKDLSIVEAINFILEFEELEVPAYIELARFTTQTLSANYVYENVIFKDTGPRTPTPRDLEITTLPSSAGAIVDEDGVYKFNFFVTWNYANYPTTTIQYWVRANLNGEPVVHTEVTGWTRFANTSITTSFPPVLTKLYAGDRVTIQAKVSNTDAYIVFAGMILERVDLL